MNCKNLLSIGLALILQSSLLYAQKASDYQYRRVIKGVSAPWHSVSLPIDVYEKLNNQSTDLKILGINEKGDTMEIPYINQTAKEDVMKKEVPYELLEQTKTEDAHYFTFKAQSSDACNDLRVDFTETNYDWQVGMEWSENGTDWKPLVDQARIVSVRSVLNNYEKNKILFPKGSYPYLRLAVFEKQLPYLRKARFLLYEVSGGSFRTYNILKKDITNNPNSDYVVYFMELEGKVPVDQINIESPSEDNFFRKIALYSLLDSMETPEGMKPQYRKLHSGTWTSVDKNEYYFDRAIFKHLKIEVKNGPLPNVELGKVEVMGYDQTLLASFPTKPGFTFYLYYGLKVNAKAPKYDLKNVPGGLTPVNLGDEEPVTNAKKSPLDFKGNPWMLGFLSIAAVAFGFVAFKRLKKS